MTHSPALRLAQAVAAIPAVERLTDEQCRAHLQELRRAVQAGRWATIDHRPLADEPKAPDVLDGTPEIVVTNHTSQPQTVHARWSAARGVEILAPAGVSVGKSELTKALERLEALGRTPAAQEAQDGAEGEEARGRPTKGQGRPPFDPDALEDALIELEEAVAEQGPLRLEADEARALRAEVYRLRRHLGEKWEAKL